MCHSFVIHY